MQGLDKIDLLILNLLQEDCRMTFTEMAKRLEVSVDTAKKRYDRLKEQKYFYPKVQLRPRRFGYPFIVDIKVKLQNYTEEKLEEFIAYLTKHHRVAELFQHSGTWDYTLVVLAKDYDDLGKLTQGIRKRFAPIIAEWTENLTTKVYKFEKYDMLELVKEEQR